MVALWCQPGDKEQRGVLRGVALGTPIVVGAPELVLSSASESATEDELEHLVAVPIAPAPVRSEHPERELAAARVAKIGASSAATHARALLAAPSPPPDRSGPVIPEIVR